MVFFIFLVLLGISAYLVMSYNSKLEEQKRQLMLLSKHNKVLRENRSDEISKNKEKRKVSIRYIPAACTKGVINKDLELLLAPLSNSPTLGKVMSGLKVEILDAGEIENKLWYEIRFPLEEGINNKGWVPEENLILDEDIITPK